MEDRSTVSPPGTDAECAVPLLYQRREYLDELEGNAATTSCKKTSNPPDYGPDD
jgi:hypothetical protein